MLDSPHLHLILIHWYVFEPPRQKWGVLMIFVFKAGVKFKIAFQIEQKILISVCYSFPPRPPLQRNWKFVPPHLFHLLIFFHLNPTQRVGEDGNRAHTPLYPILLFFFFEKCVIYELNVNEMSAILFYKRNKPTLLYVLFFTKIAWRIRVIYKRGESNPCLPVKEPTHPYELFCVWKLHVALIKK